MKYEIISEILPFDEASRLYKDSEHITSIDKGWVSIVKVKDKYYRVQQGLQEYEGSIYMQEIKIML